MTRDKKNFRTMAIGMVIIISFSGAMHVYLIKKKAIKAHRYEPTYGRTPNANAEDSLVTGGGTVEGEVVAVSFDKFFLRINKKVQPFGVDDGNFPTVGHKISVSYAGGRPPKAVHFQPLPEGR